MSDNLMDTLQYYLNSRFPNRRNLTFGVTLNILSTIAGNSIKTDITCPIQVKSNLYVLLCAPSGVGKTTIRNYGVDILNSISYRNFMPDDITVEAIPSYLSNKSHTLMTIEELSGMLGSYKKKQYLAGMVSALIKMYDSSPLSQTRTTRNSVEARNYAVNVIADIQPRLLSQIADESDVQSGFIPRFTIFHEEDNKQQSPISMNDSQLEMRSNLIEKLKIFYNTIKNMNINFVFSTEQNNMIFDSLHEYTETDLIHFSPIYIRVHTFAYKLAMIRHIYDKYFMDSLIESPNTESPWDDLPKSLEKRVNVSDSALKWAIDFCISYCKYSIPKTIDILQLNDAEKIKKTISDYELKHDKPMAESLLYRSVIYSLKDIQRIENAIKLAIKMNLIKRHHVQGGVNYRTSKPGEEETIESWP